MSVKLVRQASDTPNITNRDDSRMTRFAYGGINGVMKGYGNELTHSITGSKFGLNSGCIVLHGWEVLVDSWELDLSTVVNTQYHTVYLEVNVASESATIKSTYQTGAFPSIDAGNDLTTYPNGTARLPLYTFVVTSGRISSVTKKFILLSYYGDRLDDIEQRLDKLGFKEGSIESLAFNASEIVSNVLKRQGNYVVGICQIGNLDLDVSELNLSFIGTIPDQFLPLYDTEQPVLVSGTIQLGVYNSLSGTYGQASVLAYFGGYASISKDTGKISIVLALNVSADLVISKCTGIAIHFGYEAAPLT